MSPDTLLRDVSDTSFWVATYRARETERADALFRDPLAARLVGDRGPAISAAMGKISRYTAWSVVARTVIIDRFIAEELREGVDAIVNLGAGLDTRPYRMDLPAELPWVEVDHPHILAHKSEVLKDEKPRCHLTRVAVNLADARQRREFLAGVLPDARRVLVLTEGVIPYLTPEQVTDLARDLLAQPRFVGWVTEYFHPRVYPYLMTTARRLKMRNAPFRFYPPDWFGFFKDVGWVEKRTSYTGDIAAEFRRVPPMPLFARLIMPLLPHRIREQARRMAGYTILRRA